MNLRSNHTYKAAELAVWKRHIGEGHALQLPLLAARTNPVAVGDVIIVSLCSTKQIAAYRKNTGERIWKIDLGYLAGSHVDVNNGKVYEGTMHMLSRIDPASGQTVWSYSPLAICGEYLHAGPAFCDGRVIIGDDGGWVHCIDVATGQCVWRAEPATSRQHGVNATACVFGDRVITCTVRGGVVAYEIASGKELWRVKVRDVFIHELLPMNGDMFLYGRKAAYQLSVSDGKLIQCWQIITPLLYGAIVAGSQVFTVQKDLAAEKRLHDRMRGHTGILNTRMLQNRSTESLACIVPQGVAWKLKYPLYCSAHIKWNETTGLIYEATNYGLGIVDVDARERVYKIVDSGEYGDVGFSQPAIDGDRLYALTDKGDLYCLRHPPR